MTNLSDRMRALYAAETHSLPDNWMELAEKFDEAAAGFYAEPQTVTVQAFMGAFARARRAWCNATGESLV